MNAQRIKQAGLTEVIVVWAAVAVTALAVLTTAARFPVDRFYHVSEDGLAGAVGRTLVIMNFPMALVAIGIILIAAARLLPTVTPGWRPLVLGASAVGIGLCFVTNFAVSQDDLDARPINAIPAVGVAIAIALTLLALRANGIADSVPWRRRDTAVLIVAGVLLLLGLPWLLAQVGVYVDDIPGLSSVFISKEMGIAGDGTPIMGVHLGDHHGFDGMFLALAALALFRTVGTLQPRWLDRVLSVWLSLLLVYGLANMLQDFWNEQVVKRGWATEQLPGMLRPEYRPAWAIIGLAAVLVWLLLSRRPASAAPSSRAHGRPTVSPA